MLKLQLIIWSLLFPFQSKLILFRVAEQLKQSKSKDQILFLHNRIKVYQVIQSVLFGLACGISTILFLEIIDKLIPAYSDRKGYSWIKIYSLSKDALPFVVFVTGILLVKLNYLLLNKFIFIEHVMSCIDRNQLNIALRIGYADLSSTVVLIFILILVTINKTDSILYFFTTKNMDQYALQEQIILTLYKPISYIIMFLIVKTVIQLNSARKCAEIIKYITSSKEMYYVSFKIAVISMFLKKAFLITACLWILAIFIYLSQFVTAEFVTLKKM